MSCSFLFMVTVMLLFMYLNGYIILVSFFKNVFWKYCFKVNPLFSRFFSSHLIPFFFFIIGSMVLLKNLILFRLLWLVLKVFFGQFPMELLVPLAVIFQMLWEPFILLLSGSFLRLLLPVKDLLLVLLKTYVLRLILKMKRFLFLKGKFLILKVLMRVLFKKIFVFFQDRSRYLSCHIVMSSINSNIIWSLYQYYHDVLIYKSFF